MRSPAPPGPCRSVTSRAASTARAGCRARAARAAACLGTLLGARPKGAIALTRLPDGRLILQQFDLDGADLSVHGRGARGLTGTFSFQGMAEIPRLAGVRKDAHGALSATWRAAETGRGRPWTVAFTADGRDFASGLGQLDRLLGRAPKLTAAGQYAKGVVRVDASTLTGQSGQAKAKGTVALDGALDLKLDWSAQGPSRRAR